MKQIHIVTGDQNGIGLEVSVKALLSIGVKKNIRFCLWRNQKSFSFLEKDLKSLYSKFHCFQTHRFVDEVDSKINLMEILSSHSSTSWVCEASELCLKNKDKMALVTGPLSKVQMQKDGFLFKGHTDMLKKLTKKSHLFMCFLGQKFNVVLLTDHQPLSEVKITFSLLEKCFEQVRMFREKISFDKKQKPIGILGFNPHAGENGILGQEEEKFFKPFIEKYKPDVIGPLVPDVAFDSHNWCKYSFYICAYHDQGLIPFKMIHPKEGVHVTLGLPFVRTSVSHGTAQDIFGQNKANFISMKHAIEQAINFIEGAS